MINILNSLISNFAGFIAPALIGLIAILGARWKGARNQRMKSELRTSAALNAVLETTNETVITATSVPVDRKRDRLRTWANNI